MSNFVPPMLASPGSDLAHRHTTSKYVAQEKLDGVRAQLHSTDRKVTIYNRSGLDVTARYPEVARVRLPDCVLDGEIVADSRVFRDVLTRSNAEGNFAARAKAVPVRFHAFDLLELDGVDMTTIPQGNRLAYLSGIFGRRKGRVVAVKHSRDLLTLWQSVVGRGGEGIVVKLRKSVYEAGTRSSAWLKFKAEYRLVALARELKETPGKGISVRLEVRSKGGWWDVGSVGAGFTVAQERDMRAALRSSPSGVAVEVTCAARSHEGILRFPVFKGFTSEPVSTLADLKEIPTY